MQVGDIFSAFGEEPYFLLLDPIVETRDLYGEDALQYRSVRCDESGVPLPTETPKTHTVTTRAESWISGNVRISEDLAEAAKQDLASIIESTEEEEQSVKTWRIDTENGVRKTLQYGDEDGWIVADGYEISGEVPPEAWDELLKIISTGLNWRT